MNVKFSNIILFIDNTLSDDIYIDVIFIINKSKFFKKNSSLLIYYYYNYNFFGSFVLVGNW